MRIRLLLSASLMTPLIGQANDSSDFIGTGGIEYLKNPHIRLTAGANRAEPIRSRFTLTIERDPNELVSLCWDKSLKKVGANQFRTVKHHFTPTRD